MLRETRSKHDFSSEVVSIFFVVVFQENLDLLTSSLFVKENRMEGTMQHFSLAMIHLLYDERLLKYTLIRYYKAVT